MSILPPRRPYFAAVDQMSGDLVIGKDSRELARLRLGFPTPELEALDLIGESQHGGLEASAVGDEKVDHVLCASPRLLSCTEDGDITKLALSNLQANDRLKFLSKAHFGSLRRRGRS
jgi:hypothetical protein